MLPISTIDAAGAHLRLWAPSAKRIELFTYEDDGTTVRDRLEPERSGNGVFSADFRTRRVLYRFAVDGRGPFPDPFARSLPFGVHGPAELALDAPRWTDEGWKGVALEDLVTMEVHVGAATREGTFEALISHLQHFREVGVTALELLPVAAFPGRWNWGYDGVQLFAPTAAYGGAEGLRQLVDAAHANGLAVLLDVVYSHLGPEGNYLSVFAPEAFVRDRPTPWGDTLDLSNPVVREIVLLNVEHWIRDFHLDGLRLDATHALSDDDVLPELTTRARAAAPGRRVLVIAEDDRNDARLLRPVAEGGCGLDAVWADDFHHQVRVALTGEQEAWLQDFSGHPRDLARTMKDGWFYCGQRSRHRGRPRGTSPVAPGRCVHAIQNHDQVGNRAQGDRLGASVDVDTYKAASALLLLSPGTPLLFMGQEWNASAPFQFFSDFSGDVGRSVTEGRRREFAHFAAFAGDVPDPQQEATFLRSKLDWDERSRAPHAGVLAWYRFLAALRHQTAAPQHGGPAAHDARECGPSAVVCLRRCGGRMLGLVASWKPGDFPIDPRATVIATSDERRFGGSDRIRVERGLARLPCPGAVVFERLIEEPHP